MTTSARAGGLRGLRQTPEGTSDPEHLAALSRRKQPRAVLDERYKAFKARQNQSVRMVNYGPLSDPEYLRVLRSAPRLHELRAMRDAAIARAKAAAKEHEADEE